MGSNYDIYNDIYDRLCLEYALGNIILEDAELANDMAYSKYITEKNQLDYYAKPNDDNRLFFNFKDAKDATGVAAKYLTDPNTKGGKLTNALAKPAGKYAAGLEKGGRAIGKAVHKKPIKNDPKLLEAYNKKLNIWGKTVKVGGYLGPYVALYSLTPLATTLPKTASGKLTGFTVSSAVTPTTHIGMEINAAKDDDVQAAVRWLGKKTAPLRNKFKELCQKYEGRKITPQIKGEFDKVNAQGLAAVRKASMGMMHESVKGTSDIVSLFQEAATMYEDTADSVFYAINNADYSNPEVVETINNFIEGYM